MCIEYCYGPKWPYLIYIVYIGLFGTGKCRLYTSIVFGYSSPYKGDFARFSEVASGNPTSTRIPRVDG